MKKKLTQSQIKERQEKTKKIKSLLIRSLNIVCYCLSVLFIIMAIAIGAQSCSNKNKSETESAAINPSNRIHQRLDNDIIDISDFNYFYECKYESGIVALDYEDMTNVASAYNVETYYYGSNQPNDASAFPDMSAFTYVSNNGSLLQVTRGLLVFEYVQTSTNVWRAVFKYFNITAGGDGRRVFLRYTGNYQNNEYNFNYNVKLLATREDVDNISIINLLFNKTAINPLSFTFNNQINYNATYNANISQPFVAIGSTAQSTQTMIDIGWFYSGGKLWDGIKVYWMNAYASTFMMESGELFSVGSNVDIYSYYMMMEYRNSLTGEGVMVNSRDMVPYDNNGGLSYYVDKSSTWTSSNYQTITLITDTSQINLTNLNKYNNTTAGGSTTTSGNIGLQNGFTLVKTAFTSILPFLAIQVLPGLSIGLLLFIPLIVIIIVLVFKVVKK